MHVKTLEKEQQQQQHTKFPHFVSPCHSAAVCGHPVIQVMVVPQGQWHLNLLEIHDDVSSLI